MSGSCGRVDAFGRSDGRAGRAAREGRIFLALATVCLLLVTRNSWSQISATQADSGRLISTLQGSADAHEKARACQQLAAIGGKEAVPALAALLGDRVLGAYARSALEAIPDPAAGDALRTALGRLRGAPLAGVITSLGARRDTQSVKPLAALARGKDADAASAAIAALGRIASPPAVSALGGLLGSEGQALPAADALMAAAERLRAEGRTGQALALLDRVRKAKVPEYVRLGATGRWIVARKDAGVPALKHLLASNDPNAVRVAIASAREMPGIRTTEALASALPVARAEAQPSIIQALLDRGQVEALPAIEAAASAPSAATRVAALAALGRMSGPKTVALLIRAAGSAQSEAERDTAIGSLLRTPGPQADAAILAALPGCAAPARARLIGVLGKRAKTPADVLLPLAADADAAVSGAAFTALAQVARPSDAPQIAHLAAGRADPESRDAGLTAALAACLRNPDVGGRTKPLEAAYGEAVDPRAKAAVLIRIGEIGTVSASRFVRSRLGDPDPAIRAAAIEVLAGWHDASPVTGLLAVAQAGSTQAERFAALTGAIRLAGAAAEECARPGEQIIGWLRRAADLVGDDVAGKRVLLSALSNLKCPEGLAMAERYEHDPAVKDEAEQAANRLKAAIPAAGQSGEQALVFRPLFDGRSFDGWEGAESGAFRIQDGAIVGGSLKAGLKQNEFLCTNRSYADFVLRVECKLLNANGGIQIRSQRVPGSSEVCGYQADMDANNPFWGNLYDESRRGTLVEADHALMARIVKQNDWNQYEIRCEGPRIRLSVNGVQTVDYTEKDPEIVLSGIIGLQIHAGSPSEAWYRSIQIAEIR
jgi:HEAT repeat protein